MGIIGAILGDIAGSQYEMNPSKKTIYDLFDEYSRFTDDTVMSIATMEAMHNRKNFEEFYVKYGKKYPDAGYGSSFRAWIFADEQPCYINGVKLERKPYYSLGNGSAMRCSYIGEYYKKCPFSYFVKKAATNSAKLTHNHPEGIKGAVTIAMCVWMAERGKSKDEILQYAISQYPKDNYKFSCQLSFDSLKDSIIPSSSCAYTVPLAIRLFYENNDFDIMCKKINAIPCDTDTICAMAGCIFESFYKHCRNDDKTILNNYLDDFLLEKLKKFKKI